MESQARDVPSLLEPLVLSEVDSGDDESLFGESPCLLSPAPAPMSLYGSRRPHSSLGRATSLLETLSSPLPPARRPRQRTLSTNAAIRERSLLVRKCQIKHFAADTAVTTLSLWVLTAVILSALS